MEPVVRVEGLYKSFRSEFLGRRTEVLKDVSFAIAPGTVTGFLGGNGAGKTTTIKCLLGLIGADRGQITYFGQNELSREVKSRIGFLPERPYFYEYLTGEEFLRLYAQLSGRVPSDELQRRIDEVLDRVRLLHAKKRQLRGYSKGMLQRVGIAQAMIHRPEFIILDEPMTGLDPDGRKEVMDIIRETASLGTTVFFSSHLLHDAEAICDHLLILKEGKVVFTGELNQFLGHMDSTFTLRYRPSDPRSGGGQEREMAIANEDELQQQIDRLRAEKSHIIDIHKKKVSLEEAFIKIALRG